MRSLDKDRNKGAFRHKQLITYEDKDTIVSNIHNGNNISRILLVTLFNRFCSLYSKDMDTNAQLLNALCKRLNSIGAIDIDDLRKIRTWSSRYSGFLKRLIIDSINEINLGGDISALFREMRFYGKNNQKLIDSATGSFAKDVFIKDGYDDNPFTISPYNIYPHSRLDEFILLETIGRGASGYVYKAKNRLDGFLYAVKLIDIKNREYIRENILREVKSLAGLEHINIVRYHSAWIEYGNLINNNSEDLEYGSSSYTYIKKSESESVTHSSMYLCIQMQLCIGTLKDWLMYRNTCIHENRIIPTDMFSYKDVSRMFVKNSKNEESTLKVNKFESLRIVKHIVRGLEYIHTKNLIHRDLKPQNIFFYNEESIIPKIGDFGLVTTKTYLNNNDDALMSDSINNNHTSGIGTILYSSPEISSQFYDEKVDIYSLGIIIFEIHMPFYSEMERVKSITDLKNKNIFPEAFAEDQIKRLILRCINRDSKLRPSTEEILKTSSLSVSELEKIFIYYEAKISEKDKEIKKLLEIIENQNKLLSKAISEK